MNNALITVEKEEKPEQFEGKERLMEESELLTKLLSDRNYKKFINFIIIPKMEEVSQKLRTGKDPVELYKLQGEYRGLELHSSLQSKLNFIRLQLAHYGKE